MVLINFTRLDREEAVTSLAGKLHDSWRNTRLNKDGSYEPRWKDTTDADWIASHDVTSVDIANTEYVNLPADWQAENRAAAEVVYDFLATTRAIADMNNQNFSRIAGQHVHREWLKRNSWAANGPLDVPFSQLPLEEQEKDLAQVRLAIETY